MPNTTHPDSWGKPSDQAIWGGAAVEEPWPKNLRPTRRARITDQLLEHFDPVLFFADPSGGDRESIIRALGGAMVAAGVVDEARASSRSSTGSSTSSRRGTS